MILKYKKIIASVLTLFLTVIAVGTTTFAWFTLGTVVTVSNIQAEVRGQTGLEVRMGLETSYTDWKNNILSDDWNKLVNDAKITRNKLDSLEIINNQLAKLQENEEGYIERNAKAIKNKDYLEIVFEFRSEQENFVHLDNLEFHEGQNKKLFSPDSYFRDLNGNIVRQITVDGNNALRLTLNSEGYDPVTYYNGHKYSNTSYNVELENGSRGFGYIGQWSFLEGKNVIFDEEIENIDSLKSGVLFEKVANFEYRNGYTVKLSKENEEDLYFEAKITVWLWVDGWDPHAFNAIFEQTLGFSARFIMDEYEDVETLVPAKYYITVEDSGSVIANYYDSTFDLNLLDEAPTKEGFEFLGWFIKDNLINNFDETININEHTFIYSKWQRVP